jgi:hypothetical protein
MILGINKFVRNTVLCLMFMLAVTAACSCDSYDPDPYDNIPPVVTVEFNYLVPHQMSVLRPVAQVRGPQMSKWERNAWMVAPAVLTTVEPTPLSTTLKGSPPLVAPLRC